MKTWKALLAAVMLALAARASAATPTAGYWNLGYDVTFGTASLTLRGGFAVYKSTRIAGNEYTTKIFWLSPSFGLQVSTAATFTSSTTVNDCVGSTCAGGFSVPGDSVTASAFFGDGSHLGGITGTLTGGVAGEAAYWTGSTSLAPAAWLSITSSSGTILPTGSLKIAGGLDYELTTGTGTYYRTQFSSGTFQPLTFVLQDSTTYDVSFAIAVASGTSSVSAVVACTVNGDATNTNYSNFSVQYPNGYDINNPGTGVASWGLFNCGTGAVQTGDFSSWHLTFRSIGLGGGLTFTGNGSNSCQGKTKTTTGTVNAAGTYYGSPPWTVKCFPLTTIGWIYDLKIYTVGN